MLIRVRAAGVGPDVWHLMAGKPYLARPARMERPRIRSAAATSPAVEAVGANVTDLAPGDEVMGIAEGSFAELAVAPAEKLVRKPSRLSFEQAAAVPISGFTALQALRDVGQVQPGQRVLVIGAGGGVGTLTVQVAKAFGATSPAWQHVEARPGPLDRRRRRDRLHARGLHRRLAAVGRDRRHGGAPSAAASSAARSRRRARS